VRVGLVDAPYADTREADDEAGHDPGCRGWSLWTMTVWWDPATRVVVRMP
jgi:hypothetical protein